MSDLRDQRMTYSGDHLPDHGDEPFGLFDQWFADAVAERESRRIPEPTAMVVATARKDEHDVLITPASRVVLLKEYSREGFVFYTGYDSAKAHDLADNARAALLFWWQPLYRQVRITGAVTRVDAEQSDEYWAMRPRGSQVSATASHQSRPRETLASLEDDVRRVEQEYDGRDLPRPETWGGFVVRPSRFEFWQGQPSRLHDRLVFERLEGDTWSSGRLDP